MKYTPQTSTRSLTCVASALVIGFMLQSAPNLLAQDDTQANETQIEASGDGVTTSADGNIIRYDAAFFARFPNAVSILDIINRIPAGAAIINTNGGGNARGFSANQDRVLIDGKRISGKQNDSSTALGRITIDQVERVEIIRGTSPDIKVQSQESLLNIVLKEGAGGGSGSWEARLRMPRDRNAQAGGFLSYGNSIGDLEFFLSADWAPQNMTQRRSESWYTGTDTLNTVIDDRFNLDNDPIELSTNLTYTLGNGDQIRLNGLYRIGDIGSRTPSDVYTADAIGDLTLAGVGFRRFDREERQLEIGGDWETNLSDTLRLSVIGLYSETDGETIQFEDEFITEDPNINDFFFESMDLSTEKIGRVSFVWQAAQNHSLEIGTEMAVNTLDSDFSFSSRIGDALVEIPIAVADTRIKETRNESFVIHSWQVTDKLNIDTTIFTEWSEIEQTGDANKKRTFFFVRPNVDIRYNISDVDQVQFAIRRNIQQLNFGDFASGQTEDNQLAGGNADLAQEKVWRFEGQYERQLANDMGRVRLNAVYMIHEDRIDQIEISPLVGGRGNAGTGRHLQLRASGSIRMGFIGLPDLLLEPEAEYNYTTIEDPITGEDRNFNGWNSKFAGLNFRHDINSIGLSYGGQVRVWNTWSFYDVDERVDFKNTHWASLFAEKQLFGGLVARFDIWNLTNRQQGRDRYIFGAGRADGIITAREDRSVHMGRTYRLSVRGTF